MDRWDPYLLEAAEGDRELFARTKAFMWVESGGRQFALSATGCAGLMQFCASTAQRRPFGGIFGVGAVSACGCDDCSVPREVQIALETDPRPRRSTPTRSPAIPRTPGSTRSARSAPGWRSCGSSGTASGTSSP